MPRSKNREAVFDEDGIAPDAVCIVTVFKGARQIAKMYAKRKFIVFSSIDAPAPSRIRFREHKSGDEFIYFGDFNATIEPQKNRKK